MNLKTQAVLELSNTSSEEVGDMLALFGLPSSFWEAAEPFFKLNDSKWSYKSVIMKHSEEGSCFPNYPAFQFQSVL